MRAAQPDEQPSINRAASTLTPAQEKEMRRMDPNGDGIIDEKEQRAIARSTAGLRASKSMYQKGFLAIFVLLILSWIGNAGLMVAIVNLSKDLKVDGVALKNTKGGSVSTHGQKDVYEITLTVSGRRLDEKGHSTVATVTCMNVLQAISSLEDGEDEALVEIVAEDGGIWEPRFRAAAHYYHEKSFSMEQIQLDDSDDKLPANFRKRAAWRTLTPFATCMTSPKSYTSRIPRPSKTLSTAMHRQAVAAGSTAERKTTATARKFIINGKTVTMFIFTKQRCGYDARFNAMCSCAFERQICH